MEIEYNIPIPPARRADPNRVTPALQHLMGRYRAAYKAVHRIEPTVLWQNPWFKVSGAPDRVSRKRLMEMIRQLEYRAG